MDVDDKFDRDCVERGESVQGNDLNFFERNKWSVNGRNHFLFSVSQTALFEKHAHTKCSNFFPTRNSKFGKKQENNQEENGTRNKQKNGTVIGESLPSRTTRQHKTLGISHYYTVNDRVLRVTSLYEWRLGHSAAEATCNINAAFGEVTANERTVRRWFKKRRDGDLSLQNEQRGRPKTTFEDNHLKELVELKPCENSQKNCTLSPMTVSRHLSSIAKVKKLDKWVPHELNEM